MRTIFIAAVSFALGYIFRTKHMMHKAAKKLNESGKFGG